MNSQKGRVYGPFDLFYGNGHKPVLGFSHGLKSVYRNSSGSGQKPVLDICPHPYWMRPEIKGFSHGLKSVY